LTRLGPLGKTPARQAPPVMVGGGAWGRRTRTETLGTRNSGGKWSSPDDKPGTDSGGLIRGFILPSPALLWAFAPTIDTCVCSLSIRPIREDRRPDSPWRGVTGLVSGRVVNLACPDRA
jgi:hypothetical protein